MRDQRQIPLVSIAALAAAATPRGYAALVARRRAKCSPRGIAAVEMQDVNTCYLRASCKPARLQPVLPQHGDLSSRSIPSDSLSRPAPHGFPLQADFGFKARKVTKDGGDRERSSRAPHAHETVLAGDVAFDNEIVPTLGVADIGDRNVVMLAPEVRDRVEGLAASEHVDGGRVSLSLGHHPVLDANGFAR